MKDVYVSSNVTANDLMQDDRFKMGGAFYRVFVVLDNDFGDKVIRFYHLSEVPNDRKFMVVPKDTPFKIYNLTE